MVDIPTLSNIMLMIFRVNGRLLDKGDQLVKPFKLTSARWQVLGAVEMAQQPLSAPQIAETMGLSRQGVQKQLNKLQQEGFFEIIPNPRHERSSLYKLTKFGADSLAKTTLVREAWCQALTKKLTEEDLQKTLHTLQILHEQLSQPVPTMEQITQKQEKYHNEMNL